MTASADHQRTTAHSDMIAEILADFPNAKTHGFMRALRSLPDAEYTTGLLADDAEWQKRVKITPDAFWVDAPERTIAVYEAVHSHDISDTKFAQLNDLSWALDEDRWTLILVRVDRFGRTVWDVHGASVVAMMEALRRGEPRDNSYRVKDWQKFTAEYCDAFWSRAAA